MTFDGMIISTFKILITHCLLLAQTSDLHILINLGNFQNHLLVTLIFFRFLGLFYIGIYVIHEEKLFYFLSTFCYTPFLLRGMARVSNQLTKPVVLSGFQLQSSEELVHCLLSVIASDRETSVILVFVRSAACAVFLSGYLHKKTRKQQQQQKTKTQNHHQQQKNRN